MQAVVALCLLPLAANAANILVLTAPLYSHCLEVSSVGQELADRGHDVKIFLGDNFQHKNCFRKSSKPPKEILPIIYKTKPGLLPVGEMMLNVSTLIKSEEFDILKHVGMVAEFADLLCQTVLWNKEAIMDLKKEKFDLVLVDGFGLSYCIYLIPHALGVPHVSVSSNYDDTVTARPLLPSIVPSTLSKFTTTMTFWERLGNALMATMFQWMSRWTTPTQTIAEFMPGISTADVFRIASQSQLYLYNYDTVLAHPVPVMPNHVLVGGLATAPAKPLEGDFRKIYSQSDDDIVVVAFGSSFGLLPEKIETTLLQAFKRLKVKVLWKHVNPGEDGNVLKVPWLPQNDLLGNQKTKLFISHCGNNGVFEALYHGMPILCMPQFGDQFSNAIRVQNWKVGRYINLVTCTGDELFMAITGTLNDPTYRENMQWASTLFHSRPDTPRQRAAFWVEHILKFGGEHLRSRASDMCVFAYMGYDLVVFMLCVVMIILYVSYISALFCCRWCCKRKSGKVKMS